MFVTSTAHEKHDKNNNDMINVMEQQESSPFTSVGKSFQKDSIFLRLTRYLMFV